VIAAVGSAATALAAKSATATIPVVFAFGGSPVELGLVASFNRPGGNFTGISMVNMELAAKTLGLLKELVPSALRFAVLVNPSNPSGLEIVTRDAKAAVAAMGWHAEILSARSNVEIDEVFGSLGKKQADALMVAPDILFRDRRVQLTTLATRYGIPAVYSAREYAEVGGLMTYGSDTQDQYRQSGIYTGRILKGERPGDLPVMQPTKFELVINLQTAKTLGIAVPATLLAQADEVIE
jgi:putative ABC transport system substrate-binding protein